MTGDAAQEPHRAAAGTWCLFVLAISGFVTSFGAHIVATNLPSYAEMVGVGTFMIGLLIGVYDFAELFAKPVAGFLADKHGMKLALLSGLGIFIAGSLLYLVVDPSLLLLVRFVQGLGAAALSTVSITLVARYFPTRRGRSFGIYNAIKGAGYVTAPALGGYLTHGYGFGMIFWVSAAVGFVALVLSVFLPRDKVRGQSLEDDDDDLSLKGFVTIFKDPLLRPVYAVIFINMFLVGILFGFLPVYLHSIGFSPVRSGTVVSIATLSYLGVQPFAGTLADKIRTETTVLGGLLVAALATIGLPFTSGALLIGIVVMAGVGVGTVWTNSDALVSSLASDRQLGASIGAAQSFKELGDMLGPILIGLIAQFGGIRIAFIACGSIALALVLCFALAKGTSLRRGGGTVPLKDDVIR